MKTIEELLKSPHDLRRQYGDFYYQVYETLYRNSGYPKEDTSLQDFLASCNGLTLSEIENILKKTGNNYSKEDINLILQCLLSKEQQIVREDFWGKDPRYKLIAQYYQKSRHQRVFRSFEDDCPNKMKVFAFISDTHIGLDGIYNPNIINNFIDYIISQGATRCFHLGDLFDGISNIPQEEKEKEAHRQLELFMKEFPNPEELIIYLIEGNHDTSIGLYLGGYPVKDISPTKGDFDIEYIKENYNSLRLISALNPSVLCIPQSTFGIEGLALEANNRMFHLAHRLFLNNLQNRVKISTVDDINDKMLSKDYHYNVLVSAHLHKGFIYSSEIENNNKLYLGTPSATNHNLNGAVGYLVFMDKDGSNMEVSVLSIDENFKIAETERIPWSFEGKNKQYCKQY